jgi:hypothetical protein
LTYFIKLTEASPQEKPIFVNVDLVTSLRRYDTGSGYTTVYFGSESQNVRETPEDIIGRLGSDRAP